ncbi:helix-turn-helix protein [Clostridioides difficile]|nr:helix-turn-helix protein [Clostridioides difficile]
MSVLSDRLKLLREEKGVMQKEIANYLNITTSAYGFYEQGKRTPTPEMLSSLAEYFGTTVDYLIGRYDNKASSISSKTSCSNILFQKRLKELRAEKNMTQEDVANKLNLTKSAYGYYEQGKTVPDAYMLSSLAEIFNVTTDYLLGMSSVKNQINTFVVYKSIPHKNLSKNESLISNFGERFKQLREERKLTQDELVTEFNKVYFTSFNKSTISQYENNKRKPEINILENWADFFGISTDYLLGRSPVVSYTTTSKVKKIIKAYESLPKEAQEHINSYIEFLVDRYKK